jgi:hypothetical protein
MGNIDSRVLESFVAKGDKTSPVTEGGVSVSVPQAETTKAVNAAIATSR